MELGVFELRGVLGKIEVGTFEKGSFGIGTFEKGTFGIGTFEYGKSGDGFYENYSAENSS